jgi:hypothetical protein
VDVTASIAQNRAIRFALAAVAIAIAALLAGAAPFHAAASLETCSALSTVTTYAPAGWPEIRGRTNRGQLWVFGFRPSSDPPTAVFDGLVSQPCPLKWIWRMTGAGPLRIFATAPSGTRVNPVCGPVRHGESNWVHPGGEWGTGWFFWEKGCWRIHATRGKTNGDVFVLLR